MAGLQASNMNKKNWSTQGERGNIFALKLIAWIAMHLGRRVSRWVLILSWPISFYPHRKRGAPQENSCQKYMDKQVARLLYTGTCMFLLRLLWTGFIC
jgi:predicted LPLAT superfamily acyltransferase